MKPITTFTHNGKTYSVIDNEGEPQLKLARSKPEPKPGIYPANVTHDFLEPGDKIWIEAEVMNGDFLGAVRVKVASGSSDVVCPYLNYPELRVFVGNPVHSTDTPESLDLVLAGDLSEANIGERFEIVKGAHELDVRSEGYSFKLVSFGRYGEDNSKTQAGDWAPDYPDFDYVDNKTLLRRLS